MLGGREPSLVLSEVVQRQNYVALWRMLRRYPGRSKNLGRYFFGWGHYPYRCRVRTPSGEVAPTLYSHHDVWTVNEIFCREDYAAGPELEVAVDIGSNIGVSALYFLTRNESARCYLYEPVPENVARLRRNLNGLENRFELREAAVAEREGKVRFGVEPTGRYGGIGLELEESIEVDCLDINRVLDEILERERRIDVLKLDTEGMELATVRAIRPDLLERIDTIYFESDREPDVHAELFERFYANTTVALWNRRSPALDSLREGFAGDAFTYQASCPFCGGDSKFVDQAPNIHPERPFDFSLRRCDRCGHMWIDPLPTQPLLDHLYRSGSNSVIHAGYQSEAKLALTIPERHVLARERSAGPGRYLELGVGKGLLLEEFRRAGWDCAGVEPGDWGAGIPGVVRSLAEIEAGQFDVLVALDVLEHVRDPIAALRSLRLLARPDSRLYAAFPNRQSLRGLRKGRWRMARPLGHVHYFSRASAALMLEQAGFSLQVARTTDLVERQDLRDPRSFVFGAAQALGRGDQWLVSAVPAGPA